MNWLIIIVLTVIFFFAPFQRGLFFDSDMYFIEITVMSLFIVWGIYSFINKKVKIPNVYYLIFLLPVLYVLSFINAESPKGNFDNLFRWLTYSSFFVMLLSLRNHKSIGKYLPNIFQFTGISILLFSLAGLFGWVDYTDIVMGDRLTGPFQYANTFAAVIGAFWLYSLVSTVKSKSISAIFLYGAPLAGYGAAFFHSYSRGAFLILPIAWFIGLLLLKSKEQLKYILVTLVSVITALISFGVLTKTNLSTLVGVITLLFGTVMVILVTILLNKEKVKSIFNFMDKKPILQKYGRILPPLITAVIAILLTLDITNQGFIYKILPESLQQRIDDVNVQSTSALGRTGMYGDAFEVSKLHPLLGVGGEGWRVLFPKYQTKPYFSNEIHNGYLEILLNNGWLGLILFLFIIIGMLLLAGRKFKDIGEQSESVSMVAGLTSLSMLLLHAALDFDFSFGAVWLVLFWLFAMILPIDTEITLPKKNGTINKLAFFGRIIVLLLAASSVIYTFRFYYAEEHAALARGQIDIGEGVAIFNNSFGINPYNTDYGANLATMYANAYRLNKDEAIKAKVEDVIQDIERLEPNNARIMFKISQVYTMVNDWTRANEYMNKAIVLDKYNLEYYQISINLNNQLAQYFEDNGDKEQGLYHAKVVTDNYEKLDQWKKQFKGQHVPDPRPTQLSDESVISVARSYLLEQKPQPAFEVLKRFNPSIEQGIYDKEQDKLLVKSFDFMTLDEVLQLYSDNIIIFSVKDEATTYLPESTLKIMENMGSKLSGLKFRGSYAAVISGKKIMEETVSNDSEVEINNDTSPELASIFGGKKFSIYSAGQPFGSRSSIELSGVDYSKNERGLNIVVFDKNLNLIESFNFDTHQSIVKIFK